MLPTEDNLFALARTVKGAIKVKVRRKSGAGPENHNWKGGRSVASNGYVLIRVGIEHHLSDVRGYAYEHRIVAEEKLGRRLVAGEQVHHVNGNKQDNRPENLEVCAGYAEHKVHHRTVGFDRRLPGEANSLVRCACGCGGEFLKFDDLGRPREFVSGHNPPPAPTMLSVAACLASGPRTRQEVADEVGTTLQAVAACLSKMKARGLVINQERGVWALLQSSGPTTA